MAIAHHSQHPGRHPLPDDRCCFEPDRPELPAKRGHKERTISNRISWILAAMMLGATAGWMIFRAFLTLITLD